jgi:hypothetical protein
MFAILEGRNPWLGFPNHVHDFFWLPRHPKTKEFGYPTPFPPPQDWTSLCQKLRWHFGKFMCNSCLSKDEGNIGSKTWAFVWYHMNVTSWHGMTNLTWQAIWTEPTAPWPWSARESSAIQVNVWKAFPHVRQDVQILEFTIVGEDPLGHISTNHLWLQLLQKLLAFWVPVLRWL